MSNGYINATVLGNLTADPEVRYSQSGAAVCNLRVAVNYRAKKGEDWVDAVEFINIVTFSKTAESCGQFLTKGRQIFASGRIQTREYEKDGVKQRATEIVANEVVFCGGKQDGEPKGGGVAPKPKHTNQKADAFIDNPDDLNF